MIVDSFQMYPGLRHMVCNIHSFIYIFNYLLFCHGLSAFTYVLGTMINALFMYISQCFS